MRLLSRALAVAVMAASAGIGVSQQYYAHLLSGTSSQARAIWTAMSGHYSIGGQNYSPAGWRAVFWDNSPTALVDLSPVGVNTSDQVFAIGNGVQGGAASYPVPGQFPSGHATLWHGSQATQTDLHPVWLPFRSGSNVSGIDPFNPNLQVGSAGGKATLWRGTAASAQDIHPPTAYYNYGGSNSFLSYCNGVSQGYPVGVALFPGVDGRVADYHALIWDRDTMQATDIHDYTYDYTEALGNDGTEVVGVGSLFSPTYGFEQHALYWASPSTAPIDLAPASHYAFARAIRSGVIVGEVNNHAVAWIGADHHMINLPTLGFAEQAFGVDQFGNIVGYANGNGLVGVLWNTTPDNRAPVAVAPFPQEIEATGGATWVTLDGSASYDPDQGDSLSYEWTDQYGNIVSHSAVASVSVPLGYSFFTLTVRDTHGLSSSAGTYVYVSDTTPPQISGLSATPSSIWQPDHKMHLVELSYSLFDADPNVTTYVTVSTNGAGKDAAWEVVDSHHVLLRAEPGLKGRTLVYTVTVTAIDSFGNQSSKDIGIYVSK